MRIKKSPELFKAAEDASYIFMHRKTGDEEVAYRDFYHALCKSPPHKMLVEEYDLSLDEMIEISRNLRKCGYGWEKYFYLPIHVFYRIKPLTYILKHKEEFLGLRGCEPLKKAALNLKYYYRGIVMGLFSWGYYNR